MSRPLSIALLAAISLSVPSIAAAAESPVKMIRLSTDGAGPSHLFWLGVSPLFPDADIVAVADPLLSAIRIYTVARSGPGGAKLDQRLNAVGACAMPADFRPWRILQRAGEIHIEGMPKPTKDRQNTTAGEFTTKLISIPRDFVSPARIEALKKTGSSVDQVGWDPTTAESCGNVLPEGPAARTAPFRAVRGRNNPNRTIILTTDIDSLSRKGLVIVRAASGGKNYLHSAKELEPVGNLRVVHITEGVSANDGMVRFNQRLLTFGADDSKPLTEIGFNDSLFRSKIGQRPITVLPSGEVLAMGKMSDGGTVEKSFRIQSCGFIGISGAITGSLCSDASDTVTARQVADTTPTASQAPAQDNLTESRAASTAGETAKSIFARAMPHAEFTWSVDTHALPHECRSVEGCTVSGQKIPFVPIKGIRLSRGTYTQTGLPYAQADLADLDKFYEGSRRQLFTDALHNVLSKQKMLPGNLKDGFDGDVGIDCSALVQVAWNGRLRGSPDRLSTSQLQSDKSIEYRCPDRLPSAAYLRSGDAIGIQVKNGVEHVVLYAANISFDGASEFWLVLESSSSCDGVCWSVYDPSFFNGWGLYRASNRSDAKCIRTKSARIPEMPLPSELTVWKEKVVERGTRR